MADSRKSGKWRAVMKKPAVRHTLKAVSAVFKCLMTILLIGVIFVFFCRNNPDRVFGSAPSAQFIESCTKIFQSPEDLRVLDQTGSDITGEFTEKHRNAFDREDFDSIWKDFTDNDYTFAGHDLLKHSSGS